MIKLQRGSASMLVAAIIVVLLVATCLALFVATWLGNMRRVRSQTDLVALAAARAQLAGQSACEVAKNAVQLATETDPDLKLTNCEVATGLGEFVVSVQLETLAKPKLPAGPGVLKAQAKAGILADN